MELCLKETLDNWRASVHNITMSPRSSGSPAPNSRRTNKPLTEKRRRARINRSLAELKSILLSDQHCDITLGGRHKQGKLEKADILEMIVRYFRMLRSFEHSDLDKYRAGFLACIKEVELFLSIPDLTVSTFAEFVDRDFKLKLLKHLEACELDIEAKRNHLQLLTAPNKIMMQLSPMIQEAPLIETMPAPIIEYDEPLDYSMNKKVEEEPIKDEEVFENPEKLFNAQIELLHQYQNSLISMYTPPIPQEKVVVVVPDTYIQVDKNQFNTPYPPQNTNKLPPLNYYRRDYREDVEEEVEVEAIEPRFDMNQRFDYLPEYRPFNQFVPNENMENMVNMENLENMENRENMENMENMENEEQPQIYAMVAPDSTDDNMWRPW